jgi:hypothetical protein
MTIASGDTAMRNVIFILEPSETAKAAIGKYATFSIIPMAGLRSAAIAYRTFDKIPDVGQGAIADSRRPGGGMRGDP